jgi:SOS-response transcriptional repressor LexA
MSTPHRRHRPLNESQLAIHRFVVEYHHSHGYPPSVREIAMACQLSRSTATVHAHLGVLVRSGLLEKSSSGARAYWPARSLPGGAK